MTLSRRTSLQRIISAKLIKPMGKWARNYIWQNNACPNWCKKSRSSKKLRGTMNSRSMSFKKTRTNVYKAVWIPRVKHTKKCNFRSQLKATFGELSKRTKRLWRRLWESKNKTMRCARKFNKIKTYWTKILLSTKKTKGSWLTLLEKIKNSKISSW